MADSHHLENRQIYNVMMMQNGSLKRIGRLPSWIFKIQFFTLQVH